MEIQINLAPGFISVLFNFYLEIEAKNDSLFLVQDFPILEREGE